MLRQLRQPNLWNGTYPSISFFIDRSDLNGSKDRQNEISRHCRSSVASLKR